MADLTIDDVFSYLKGTVAPYGNNLPSGGPAKTPAAVNATTKGEIEAAKSPAATLSAEQQEAIVNASGGGEAGAPTGTLPGRQAVKQGGIEAWMAKNLPWITGPARTLGATAALPLDVGADMLRSGVHGAFGLQEAEPYRYSGKRSADIMEALGDTVAPVKVGLDAVRASLIEAGARPSAPSAPAAATAKPGGMGPTAPKVTLAPFAPSVPAMRPPRAPTPAMAQGGAFSTPSGPTMPSMGPSPGAQVAGPLTEEGALAQPPAKSLADEFRKRSAEIGRDPDGKLTADQKAQAEMDFWLGMISRSAKPGGRALGAFADSGLDVSKKVTDATDKNLSRSERKIAQTRADLAAEMNFGNIDADNARGDRRAATEEKRWQATDKKDTERLQLLRDQFDRDGTKVVGEKVLANGNIGFMTADKKVVDSGVRAKGREANASETAYAMLTGKGGFSPEDAVNRIYPDKGKDDRGISQKDLVAQAVELVSKSMSPVVDAKTGEKRSMNLSDAVNQILAATRGMSAANEKPDPVANKGRTMSGPDGRFKSDGKKWVKDDTLPRGAPPGAFWAGTSDGKNVYQTPDGRRFIEK